MMVDFSHNAWRIAALDSSGLSHFPGITMTLGSFSALQEFVDVVFSPEKPIEDVNIHIMFPLKSLAETTGATPRFLLKRDMEPFKEVQDQQDLYRKRGRLWDTIQKLPSEVP
uniref:Uncharacterized protein n=1 Tax=Acrobeloides nanus TaxID=290746 RepID=A0A914DK50_9BILA